MFFNPEIWRKPYVAPASQRLPQTQSNRMGLSTWSPSKIAAIAIVLCLLRLCFQAEHVLAAPPQQLVAVRDTILRGELPYQFNAHYLGLEPTLRDGAITLTLAYDPQNNPNLRGFVNFFVLDEDGLRRFLAGENPRNRALATGSPVPFDPIGNKVGAAFRAVGRGKYTVIVYNNSSLPITYALTANGGILVDNANQTLSTATSLAEAPTAVAPPTATPVASTPLPGLGNARAPRLSGSLVRRLDRHYLSLIPTIRDGAILFNFHYDPLDQPDLVGKVNFWILDQNGLNALTRGAKPADVNLATGFPAPFSPFPNDLQANFNASGNLPYTVVVYNNSDLAATYEILVDGAALSDLYGQTNEAKQATVTSTDQITAVTPTPAATPLAIEQTAATAIPFGVPQLAGSFTQAYQHHYFSLMPTVRDGIVTLTLDFAPMDNQALRENIHFLVLTEEGLRLVINGARPIDHDFAAGVLIESGVYKDKLYAAFNASGRPKYTVIVFNNSSEPARYLLQADGALLATEDVNVSLP